MTERYRFRFIFYIYIFFLVSLFCILIDGSIEINEDSILITVQCQRPEVIYADNVTLYFNLNGFLTNTSRKCEEYKRRMERLGDMCKMYSMIER